MDGKQKVGRGGEEKVHGVAGVGIGEGEAMVEAGEEAPCVY